MRVLVIDNHPATRLGVEILLRGVEGAKIVGEATRSEEALRMAEELRPDLAILDPELGDGRREWGICGRLKALDDPPRVLIYSARASREDVAAASLAGADGYLSKSCKSETLPEVVDRICEGQRFWLLDSKKDGSGIALRARIEGATLTPKQREVLALVANRRTNPEIAEELHLSVNTVKTHVRDPARTRARKPARALQARLVLITPGVRKIIPM